MENNFLDWKYQENELIIKSNKTNKTWKKIYFSQLFYIKHNVDSWLNSKRLRTFAFEGEKLLHDFIYVTIFKPMF